MGRRPILVLLLVVVVLLFPLPWPTPLRYGAAPCSVHPGLNAGGPYFRIAGPSGVTIYWATSNGAPVTLVLNGPGLSYIDVGASGSTAFSTDGGTFAFHATEVGCAATRTFVDLTVVTFTPGVVRLAGLTT